MSDTIHTIKLPARFFNHWVDRLDNRTQPGWRVVRVEGREVEVEATDDILSDMGIAAESLTLDEPPLHPDKQLRKDARVAANRIDRLTAPPGTLAVKDYPVGLRVVGIDAAPADLVMGDGIGGCLFLLKMSDGSHLFAAEDAEGNGPGCLWRRHVDGSIEVIG